MRDFHTNAKIELLPSECGKWWTVEKTFTVYSKRFDKYITINAGFKHDRYTFVPNLSDETPAVVHDFLYDERVFDDGTKCTKRQADLIFYDLIKAIEGKDKRWAKLYYIGVVIFGVVPWTYGTIKKVTDAKEDENAES